VNIEQEKLQEQTGGIFLKKTFPDLISYDSLETKEAAEEFLCKAFQSQNPNPGCTRESMCKETSCKFCVNLFRLYLDRRTNLINQRNHIYYDYMVRTSIQ
jgi:hypothetical protein